MSYYIKPWARIAVFALEDHKKHEVQKVSGRVSCNEPIHLTEVPNGGDSTYPTYEAVTVDGITEMIEHKKMGPVFYVTNDAAIRDEYLAIGCG